MLRSGISLMLLACLFSTATSGIAKYLSQNLGSVELVFFRSLIGFVILYPFTNFKGVDKKNLSTLIIRALIGTIAILMYFYNISTIGFAKSVTFTKSAPIFLAIIGFFYFKERLNLLQISAILLGLVGIYLIFDPKGFLNINDILGVINAILIAIAYALIKELRKFYSINLIIISFLFFASFLPAIFMILANFIHYEGLNFMIQKFIMPSKFEFMLLIIMGIAGVCFQIFMSKAYSSGTKIGLVGGISYIEIVFSIITGNLLGDNSLKFQMIIGIIFIIISGILISLKDKN